MRAPTITAPDVRDRAVIEVFERHIQWEARPCLVCGGPGGPECVRCHVEHDKAVEASTDV